MRQHRCPTAGCSSSADRRTGGAVLPSAELFDPASNTFTALPASGHTELQTARVNFAAVPMPGGKVLIAGGAGASAVLAGAEIFDPATETFTALPASGATELQTPRTAPAAAALPDGRVLIAGGDTSASGSVTSADVLSSAEVFDPASGTFSALPASGTTQLQNPRSYTAATALGNGQILIAGGAGPDYLASAELATLPPSCSPSSASLPAGARNVQVALHCAGFSFAYAIVNGPAHGSLGVVDQAHGTLTYTPDAGFAGADSFTLSGDERGRALGRGDRDGRGSGRAPIGLARERLRPGRIGLTADHLPRRIGDTVHRRSDVHDARDLPRVSAHQASLRRRRSASPR